MSCSIQVHSRRRLKSCSLSLGNEVLRPGRPRGCRGVQSGGSVTCHHLKLMGARAYAVTVRPCSHRVSTRVECVAGSITSHHAEHAGHRAACSRHKPGHRHGQHPAPPATNRRIVLQSWLLLHCRSCPAARCSASPPGASPPRRHGQCTVPLPLFLFLGVYPRLRACDPGSWPGHPAAPVAPGAQARSSQAAGRTPNQTPLDIIAHSPSYLTPGRCASLSPIPRS